MMRLFGKRGSSGKRSRAGERGQALLEFSIVAIIFFMLFFGVFDTARMFESWVTVQHAAREGARYAITGRVNCDGYETGNHRDECIVQTAYHATTGLTGGGDDATAIDVSYEFWDYPDYVDPALVGAGAECDQIEVVVSYDHKLITPIISSIVSSIPIKGKQRMTNEPFGTCHANDGGAASIPPTQEPTATPAGGSTPTNTPAATNTPGPTFTPTSTATSVPTSTPTDTATPVATSTPTNTATSVPTATPTNTATSVPTSTPTRTPTPGFNPSPTPTTAWYCYRWPWLCD